MFSEKPPEFFLDRSLGRITADRLRAAGLAVHLIADHSPNDAQDVPDEAWISDGCGRGWVLLTKDRRIRYRAQELAALAGGFLFFLADGNATIDAAATAWVRAMPRIDRAVRSGAHGFWHAYADGNIRRMWP